MKDMKGYVVISNCYNSGADRYEVDTDKPIAQELVRVLVENSIILYEDDKITFESEAI
jgi:hypothetical protein